jgi:hypothetical protein
MSTIVAVLLWFGSRTPKDQSGLCPDGAAFGALAVVFPLLAIANALGRRESMRSIADCSVHHLVNFYMQLSLQPSASVPGA